MVGQGEMGWCKVWSGLRYALTPLDTSDQKDLDHAGLIAELHLLERASVSIFQRYQGQVA